jgi:predicted AAA+ superfamily ATPase
VAQNALDMRFHSAASTGLNGVPRHLKIETVSGKVTICSGVRRCGKSTLMFQLIRRLLDSGIRTINTLWDGLCFAGC